MIRRAPSPRDCLLRALPSLLLLALPGWVAALEAWPDVRYDDAIPTLAQVVGHDLGEDITAPDDLARYLRALTAAAPERTRLVEYARSWEGRPLHYLVIGNADNVARLADVRAGMQRLADPRGLGSAERDRLLADLPAVVWLAHGVHGDEISSSDAALSTAYHLLAARDDAVADLLERTVVVIDPSQNPDGRARFVHHYRSLRGLVPQPSPIAAERAQAWPGGRTNHYLFDMNRDWFALTQPEVAGRVRAFLDYFPLVHVDLHEMGTDSSYYFPPPAVPYNPYLTERQRSILETLGRGAAELFDRFGFRYYTREVYDAYYPGYGDTWPALHGAAGMTFEMASARGMLGQRSDGSLVSYRDGVQRHFVASLAAIRTAAAERRRLLQAFLEHRSGSGDGNLYLLSRNPDPGRADKLARVLMDQGVEVRRLSQSGRLCEGQHEAGTYVVSTDQPAGRLAGTLLAAESPADAAFWQEQERRAAKRLPVEVYDVVAWSLPLLFGVPVTSCRAAAGGYPVVNSAPRAEAEPPGEAAVAYLVPWGSQAAAQFLARALMEGLAVETATEALSRDGLNLPRGTLILRRSANGPDMPQRMAELARDTGARAIAADDSWVEGGIDFGSERVRNVRAPHVALAWDEPTVAGSAGAWRYLLERKLGYPVAPVRVRDLGSRWLDQFDVLVLPDGEGYAAAPWLRSVRHSSTWRASSWWMCVPSCARWPVTWRRRREAARPSKPTRPRRRSSRPVRRRDRSSPGRTIIMPPCGPRRNVRRTSRACSCAPRWMPITGCLRDCPRGSHSCSRAIASSRRCASTRERTWHASSTPRSSSLPGTCGRRRAASSRSSRQ